MICQKMETNKILSTFCGVPMNRSNGLWFCNVGKTKGIQDPSKTNYKSQPDVVVV